MSDPCRSGKRREDGATATEYLFLLAFVALAIIAGATFLGNSLDAEYSDAATSVSTALNN